LPFTTLFRSENCRFPLWTDFPDPPGIRICLLSKFSCLSRVNGSILQYRKIVDPRRTFDPYVFDRCACFQVKTADDRHARFVLTGSPIPVSKVEHTIGDFASQWIIEYQSWI